MTTSVEQMTKVTQLAQRIAPRTAPPAPDARSLELLHPTLYAAHDLDGGRTEALRELRSQLLLRWFGQSAMLAVVGAHAADDAATLAANLAIVMAHLGEQTLLIDADMRSPRQHELFGLEPEAGLADVLQNCDLCDTALTPIAAVPKLHVLCAGAVPANPQELISRTPFTYLTKTLPDRFSAVIVVTPPVLRYADAQIIAARTRGCLLVTRRHRTRLADVARVKARLEPAQTTLVGGVIRE
jgi:capsular exopolysaccharide synthesis family protein